MDILAKKELYLYPDLVKTLISNIKIGENPIVLLGSASLKSQQFFSDYDLYSKVKIRNPQTVYNFLVDILDYIETIENLRLVELKIELKDGSKLRELVSFSKFKEIFKNISFIKLDFIGKIGFDYKEISIIYDFDRDKRSNELEKSLKDDIEKFYKEGEYFKVLKRLFNLFKLREDKQQLLKLSKVLNSSLGADYVKLTEKETRRQLGLLNESKRELEREREKLNSKALDILSRGV
jgi:hypothetical protein